MKIKEYIIKQNKTLKLFGQEYYFNSFFFSLGMLVLLLSVLAFMSQYDFDKSTHIFLSCPNTSSQTPCENPLYKNFVCYKNFEPFLCEQEFFQPGFEYGVKPPFIINNFKDIAIFYVFLLFFFNHLIFNSKFSFKKLQKEEKQRPRDEFDEEGK
jgi:hypothetical protein